MSIQIGYIEKCTHKNCKHFDKCSLVTRKSWDFMPSVAFKWPIIDCVSFVSDENLKK